MTGFASTWVYMGSALLDPSRKMCGVSHDQFKPPRYSTFVKPMKYSGYVFGEQLDVYVIRWNSLNEIAVFTS